MDNTLAYALLSERTDRSVRNRIRPADNSVRSLHHHVQTSPSHAESPGAPQSLSSRPGLANIIPKDMRKCAGSSAQWLRGREQVTAGLSIICHYP